MIGNMKHDNRTQSLWCPWNSVNIVEPGTEIVDLMINKRVQYKSNPSGSEHFMGAPECYLLLHYATVGRVHLILTAFDSLGISNISVLLYS